MKMAATEIKENWFNQYWSVRYVLKQISFLNIKYRREGLNNMLAKFYMGVYPPPPFEENNHFFLHKKGWQTFLMALKSETNFIWHGKFRFFSFGFKFRDISSIGLMLMLPLINLRTLPGKIIK